MTRPRRSETVLTAEHLRRVLLYDPYTGLWKWRENGRGRSKVLDWRPGYLGRDGYPSIRILNRLYLAHRLAFLYMMGRWPRHELDHIDGDRANNRWGNLREATRTQNMKNTGLRATNTSGFRGVSFSQKYNRWEARMRLGDSKQVFLGYFATPDDASKAYEAAAKEAFGEYYRRLN
jgi:HNH endonuclease/AP2 domain